MRARLVWRALSLLLAALVAPAGGAAALAGGAGDDVVVVSLDYHTDPALAECPGAADFRKAVTRPLGRDPFREEAARHLLVRVYPTAAGMEGRVEWRDASDRWEGERRFASRNERCAQLLRAMALATAIQIQLLAGSDTGLVTPPREEPSPAPRVPPLPVMVAAEARPAPAAPARVPRVAVDVGVGVIQDAGEGPTMVAPRIAVTLGRPSALGVRAAASGLGPAADVSRPEGVAQIDRLLATVQLVRFLRPGRRWQPVLAVGAGWQDVRVRGFSAMPSLARAHEGHVSSALVAASGGVAIALAEHLSLVVEVEALLFRPSVAVQIGAAEAAHLDGAALFAHGGVLARF